MKHLRHPVIVCLALILLAPLSQAETKTEQAAAVTADQKPAPAAEPAAAKPAVSDAETLEAAYKREFAFLSEQRNELKSRLGEFRSKSQQSVQGLSQRISALERENLQLSNREDELRTQLTTAEHKDESLHERSELLEMTYSQANGTLKNYGRSLEKNSAFTEGANEVKINLLFSEAHELLKSLGTVRTTPDTFFLLDGTEVEGQIVTVGNIAAYGVSAQGSGILIPAGNNRFRLWPETADSVAQGMLDGHYPPLLKLFLFENKERAIDIAAEKTIIDIIESGGLVGWVIVCLGALALILAAVRSAILYFNSANAKQTCVEVFSLLEQDQDEQALAYCQKQRGPFARLLSTTLENANVHRDHMEDVISEALLHEFASLNRFGSTILVIASISPLLGLLGTVTGMISTFDIITEFGTGDPKMLSGGISIALVTTQLGLIVAIPAVLLGTLLNSWAESIKSDLEEAALKASNILLDGEQPTAPPVKIEAVRKWAEPDVLPGEVSYANS
ncbi:MAG: MotA/TolQ/ExbB proton channel family protein [Methylobacter sp.]|nr:MotA/TolQ/ExbB proton channel family protein [Methylobacter sp.]MDP2429078.1 MotA/TolQ/ExbB proton channel family protein [Methylobacter sp.]MDP3054489.1 MotA/TolQ/ExbB proton channel family protein [Methylobacter sp.]MDP3362390.1 MotA/TolQ/ExbB proton channel family protein [Methylobacter sp.]MDZ4218936.1 MotA/TolQ/ExbB proton channel family protein [Methylobacter sp.]